MTTQPQSQSQSGISPFSNLRSLVASLSALHCLLECTALPRLHSLTIRASADKKEPEQRLSLSTCRPLLPSQRRLRVEGLEVYYPDLLVLPNIEHVDIKEAIISGDEVVSAAQPSPSLRQLLLPWNFPANQEHRVHGLLNSLQLSSLQYLSMRAQLTNDDLLSLTSLHSLTTLVLQACGLDDTDTLVCLMSDKAEPLLPNLQRFAIGGSDADEIDYDDMRTSTAAFLQAYSRQLRHIKLASRATRTTHWRPCCRSSCSACHSSSRWSWSWCWS